MFSQGESVIDCFEVNTSEPYLSQGNTDVYLDALLIKKKQLFFHVSWSVTLSLVLLVSVSHCLTDVSTRGVALVPKLALDVSCCEVLRLMQLTDSFIVPISYQVPRKVRTNTPLTLNIHIQVCWHDRVKALGMPCIKYDV